MKISRTELLDKLLRVSPALLANESIPVMSHFWFTGTQLVAFNDQISISVPFESDLIGAVPGALFLSLLKNSKARDIRLEITDGVLKVRAGRTSTFTLSLLDDDHIAFEIPTPKARQYFKPKRRQQFLDGIQSCLMSVGSDAVLTNLQGITLVPEDDGFVSLFSTDAFTMCHALTAMRADSTLLKDRRVLPTAFCRQLRHFADKTFSLEIYDNYCLLTNSKTETLFGRLIQADSPHDFHRIMKDVVPHNYTENLVSMPDKMKLILERAIIINKAAIQPSTSVSVEEKGRMHFESTSSHGVVADNLLIEDAHPTVTARFEPKLLKVGYDHLDRMLITRKCAIMTNENNNPIYMIAAANR